MVLTVGLFATGLIGIAWAIKHALPLRSRVANTLTWLVPAAVLYYLALYISDVLPALVLLWLAMGLYFAMMASPTANRWWLRNVLRSRDPWVLRQVPEKEMDFLEQLSLSLRRVITKENKLASGAIRTADFWRVLEYERSRISRLSPPDDRWVAVLRGALAQLDLVAVICTATEPLSGDPDTGEREGWLRLEHHLNALRYDQAWPQQGS